MDSWLYKRDISGVDPSGLERSFLPTLFDKYIDATNELVRKGFKECTPLYLLNKVSTVVYLLEGLLDTMTGEKKTNDILENLFIFCVVWAFGGPMISDKSKDYRKYFNEAFQSSFSGRFPKDLSCFDCVWSFSEDTFVEWTSRVPAYVPIPIGGGQGETPFTSLFVPTADTVRLTFLMDTLARKGKHAMLVGSGSGKTSIVNQYLGSLDKDTDGFVTGTINMSYYTDSKRLQQEIELPIDKVLYQYLDHDGFICPL